MASLRDQLCEAIRRDGRSINELARASGVHKSGISRLLSNQNTLSLESCEKVITALGCTASITVSKRRKPSTTKGA